jgi:phage shock protein C
MSTNTTYSGGPYRARKGMLAGVCAGLAQHFDISIFWTRMFTFIAFLFTGFFPVGLVYLMLALLMKRAPLMPSGYHASWDERLWQTRAARGGSLDERFSRVQNAAR